MCSETAFQVLAVISPFASGYLTYLLTQRSKMKEYLYQYRIPASVEVFKAVAEIKKFAEGQIALALGNEFAPVFDEPGSPLSLRTSLAQSREMNDIFLTEESRNALDRLDATLGILSSAYLSQKNIDGSDDYDIDYKPLFDLANTVQRTMYNEINLPAR